MYLITIMDALKVTLAYSPAAGAACTTPLIIS